ncbi:MAG TPA: putative Ig domain-containing protein [Polyangiaceae bacterium]|jgi:hypothetical protein|nr:putative Ig domain-containing protein [Polyangiaceae bacterium]
MGHRNIARSNLVRRGALRVVGTVLGAVALFSACSTDFNVEDCKLTCNTYCPSGLECRDGYCVHPGSTAVCSSESPDAGNDASLPGTGGASAGGATGTGGVTGKGGGDASFAGDAGTSPCDDCILPIAAQVPAPLCSGQPLDVPLTASGGRSPYQWRLVGDAAGFALSAVEGDSVNLVGTPGAGDARVTVRIRDAAGVEGQLVVALHVHETPKIVTTTLPDACVGNDYAATLKAEGGDSSKYQWLADGGFTTSGASLLEKAASLGNHMTNVTVTDGTCTSAATALTVKAIDGGKLTCPALRAATPPAPCSGEPYSAQFIVAGGAQPLTWKALSAPTGLSLDQNGTLSGITTSSGTFTVQVTDASGHTTEESYALPVRTSCWLAFVSPTGLGIVDPLLPSNHRQVVADTGITDFSFSPDGQYLAYRTTGGTTGPKVHILAAPDWHELPFNLTGTPMSYAWSPDSKTLAAVLDARGFKYLGGVRLVGTEKTDGGTTSVSALALAGFLPEADSGVVGAYNAVKWVDTQTVTYVGADRPTDANRTTSPGTRV